MDQNQIDLLWQIKYAIRNEFLYPGGYRVVVYHGGDVYCADCARVVFRELVECVRDGRLYDVGTYVHEEGYPMHCDGCNTVIESEYGPIPAVH